MTTLPPSRPLSAGPMRPETKAPRTGEGREPHTSNRPTGSRASRRVLLIAAAVAAFVVLAWSVTAVHGRPFGIDRALHTWAVTHRPPIAILLARMATDTGTGPLPYAAALIAGWTVCRPGTCARREAASAVAAAAVLAGGQLTRLAVAAAVARPRPPAADWAAAASGHAFPSGHTTTSAIAAGLLAWAALRLNRPMVGRICASLCICWTAAVGATRVYLGVHWPSDVLGGWLLAACWLAAVLPLLSALTGHSDRQLSDPHATFAT